jgi:hypothetical protein
VLHWWFLLQDAKYSSEPTDYLLDENALDNFIKENNLKKIKKNEKFILYIFVFAASVVMLS